MLTFATGRSRDCDGVSRRSFLQIGALTGLGLSLPLALAAKKASAASPAGANCILIWTRGGTSHHDTFDPKPEATASIKGEFGFIDTAIPGVKFTDICPTFAKEIKRFGLLRGWNPKNGSHGNADQYVMSGRPVSQAIRYPTFGSVSSYYLGFKSALPPFVQLGTEIDQRQGGGRPGILGLEHGPFEIAADPSQDNFVVRDITPPSGITAERIDFRKKVLAKIDQLQRRGDIQPAAFAALDENYKTALNMITAPETKGAFDLSKEDPKVREAYGKNKFGQSCLLARRLIEAGVRFVTVTDGGWDTHQNNFKSLKDRLMPRVDQGLPQLVIDLEQRGLLDSTLVVWLTDFGRTPQINAASGRDHWASAGYAMMAGARIPGGSVLGATDPDGGFVTKDEYLTEDLATTIYAKLGIPTDLIAHAPDGRPIRLIEGREIKEWM
jgi:hypothetical protein